LNKESFKKYFGRLLFCGRKNDKSKSSLFEIGMQLTPRSL
jgi:hypothetical protein